MFLRLQSSLRLFGTKQVDACLRCPSCQSCFRFGMGALPCLSCGTVQGKGEADFFALLGVRREFRVDVKTAESQYKKMQFLVHPDRSEAPEEYCALLNEAIATLKNPLRRADHLLKLHGIAETSEAERVQDMCLLMEIMEVNEEIDEARNDRQALERIYESLQKKLHGSEQRIADLYDGRMLEDVKRETDRMRFIVRTVDRVEELLRF